VDGQKVIALINPLGRMAGIGMEGKKLKIVLHVKGVEQDKWLDAILSIVEGLRNTEKKERTVS